MDLRIAFDKAKNQVDGRVSVCRPVTNTEPRKMQSCQNIFFCFPVLRYDDPRKAVLLGAEIAARNRGLWRGGWKLEAGFAPDFDVAEKPDPDGFTQKCLEIALVHKE
jgi:hypothetical protein